MQEQSATMRRVNDCPYDFPTLVGEVLPRHLETLRAQFSAPVSMSMFAGEGRGPKAIAEDLRKQGRLVGADDFRGLYVLIEGDTPIYVGISRSVLARLRTHVTGDTHNTASLAYSMAAKERQEESRSRKEAMEDPEFYATFLEKRAYLQVLSAAFVPVENDLELYVLEPFLAVEFNTYRWNTFRTH